MTEEPANTDGPWSDPDDGGAGSDPDDGGAGWDPDDGGAGSDPDDEADSPIRLLIGLVGAVSGSLLVVCLVGWLITGSGAFAGGMVLFAVGIAMYALLARRMSRAGDDSPPR